MSWTYWWLVSVLYQTWLTVKNAFSPNFHTEWSNSCLQDLANQTLLPLALPNYTANNFHCDWARWANQATQARQLFTSFCPRGLRRTGMAFFRVSHVCCTNGMPAGASVALFIGLACTYKILQLCHTGTPSYLSEPDRWPLVW